MRLRVSALLALCSRKFMLLPQATRDTNAWVVTGGTNGGVMKLVGDSLSEHQNSEMLLGVASWGQSFTYVHVFPGFY